jgi:L-galactose dehydrogenase
MRANSLVLELRLTLSYPAKPCPVVHDAEGNTVERVVLGRTGLEVSVAGLGCGGPSRLGQASDTSKVESIAIVRQALDSGVNFVDTSVAYGTEAIVGQAVKGRRGSVVLCTKVPPITRSWLTRRRRPLRPKALHRALEGSLKRLHTDYVDIYLLHAVMPHNYAVCRDELLPALEQLKQQGKLRFFGLSEAYLHDADHMMLQRALEDDCWDVIMLGFSLRNPSARKAVLPAAQARKVGTLAMFAARDLLDDQGRSRVGGRAADPAFLADAAYRFCRHERGIHVTMTGTGKAAHLKNNLASMGRGPLSDSEQKDIELLLTGK